MGRKRQIFRTRGNQAEENRIVDQTMARVILKKPLPPENREPSKPVITEPRLARVKSPTNWESKSDMNTGENFVYFFLYKGWKKENREERDVNSFKSTEVQLKLIKAAT